jgi:galactokinase
VHLPLRRAFGLGGAYQVLANYHVRGFVIDNFKTDHPIKKGLSSSAAVCVLTVRFSLSGREVWFLN